MKENIEEDIEILEELQQDFINLVSKKFVIEEDERRAQITAIEHVLSDYKRVLKENEELKEKWDKDTHKLQNDLDIANAEIIELKADRYELNNRVVDLLDNIPVQKVKDILNEINKEYIKQEKIFNKHFEKEERDIQDYYIQKEATNIMQELSWVEGKLQDLLEEKGE